MLIFLCLAHSRGNIQSSVQFLPSVLLKKVCGCISERSNIISIILNLIDLKIICKSALLKRQSSFHKREFQTTFIFIHSTMLPYNLLFKEVLKLSHGAQPLGEKAQFEAKSMWRIASGAGPGHDL